MKKILLLISIVFISLFSNKTNAQTIDSVITSQYIECPGGQATIDVFITQSIPVTNYDIVLQKLNNTATAYQFEQHITNTTITFAQFTALFGGNYRVLIVNPALNQSTYPTGLGNVLGADVYSQEDHIVGSPANLFYTISNDSLLCWYDTTTTLTVDILNGYTSPYTITLFDDLMNLIQTVTSPSGFTFNNLSAGDYNISVTDTFTCPPVAQQYTITGPDTLDPRNSLIVVDSISCYDADDGQITLDPIGGTPFTSGDPYLYEWYNVATGIIGNTSNPTGNVLPPGDYYAIITDANGCDTITDTLTLINPDSLGASTTFTNPVCNGNNNGSITITIDSFYQGAGGPFEYSNNGGAWQSFPGFSPTEVTLQNLTAGIYANNSVRDVDGCEFLLPPDTLTEPPPLEFSIDAISYNGFGVSCNGVCDAEITIDSVWGGNLAPYGFSSSYYTGVSFISPLLIEEDSCISQGIGGGSVTFNYDVTDSLGCVGNESITLSEPPLFTISHTVAIKANGTNLSCASSCDGEITVTPSNGVDSISYYYIDSLFAQDVFPNSVFYDTACATPIGGDTLVAIDANGCADTNVINLSSPPPFSWNMGATNENCALANGEVWVSGVTGGVTPYIYDWTASNGTGPFTNTDSIENLNFGWYYLTLTDGLGCTFSDSAFVDSAYILVDYTVNVPCNAVDNGEITINTNNVLLSEVTLLLIDTITIPNTTSTIVSYVSTYSGGGLLIQDPNIDTVMTFNGLASTTGNEVYELRVELFGNPQGTAGCDPESYYIELGDSVTMDASLDSLNSDLNLTCFGDSTSAIEIKVFDTFIDDTGAQLPNSPNNNSYQANLSGGIFNTFVSNNAPFNVLFNPTPPPGNDNYLPAGNYTILVTSNLPEYANCIDTVLVDVIQPDSFGFTLAGVSPLCFQGNDGYAGIDTIFGGTSPYFYSWTDSVGNVLSNIDSAFNLTAGFYTLAAQDVNFCPSASEIIEIFDQLPITYVVDTVSIDICSYQNSTGEFLITSSGGVGSYTYNWWNFDSTWTTTSNNPIGLNSEWFNFMVTDSNACTVSDSAFIPNGVDPMLDQNYIDHVSCFGASDGSYIAVVDSLNPLASSASPFAFWNPNTAIPFYDPTYTPQDSLLGPDTIVIQIQDALGCQASDTIIIIEPDLLEITHFDTLTYIGGYNVSCNGSLDGEIIVNAVGGTPIYSYWVQNISTTHPASNNDTISGLAATYYWAYVEDNNGCLDSLEIFMTQPDSLLIDSFFLDTTTAGGWNVSCFGFSDGQANVYVSGGNLGYSYVWSNGDTTNIADTLSANISYTVTVTDTNGCTALGSTAVLTEPTPLVIDNIIPTHLLCLGGDNGSATVIVSGATPGYAYLWDNANDTIPTYFNPNDTVASFNDTTALADTLRAGTYSVQVFDANGCFVTQSVTLTEPSISITIDSLAVTQMTCFTYNNADVEVFTTGPQPTPYLYTLYNEANVLDTIYALNAMSPSPQGNVAFSGLDDMTYVVYVEDNLGCLDRDTFIIDPLDSVYIDSVIYSNVSCNGYDDGYIVDIMPMGGIPPYQYSIDGGLKYPSWICNQNPNTCPTGFVFTGLAPGPYNVEIWDSNMCANSYQIIITEPNPMIIVDSTSNYNNYQIACNGGTDNVWFDIQGGAAPYNVTDGSSTYPTNGSFTWPPLAAGAYTFTITDNNGCEQVFNIILNEPPSISVSPIITDVFCAGDSTGNITAVVSGGVGNGNANNYTYEWTDINDNLLSTSYFVNNLPVGDYTIKVTDANGCIKEQIITIGANVLQIIASSSTITNVGCFDDCDGSIMVDVTGGVPSSTGAYSYQWDDPLTQTTQTAIGLCGGLDPNPITYTCIVTDMAGCSDTLDFDVYQPTELIAAIVPIYPNVPGINPPIQAISPILCNGDEGDLKVTTAGGAPIISYLWSSGSTTNTASNLIAGSYSCFVTDINGCTDTAHYFLDEPDVLGISTTDFAALCHGEATGEIQVVATGGTPIPGSSPSWTYELLPGATTPVNPIVGSIESFTLLPTGIYTVTVTDFHNCVYTTDDIFVDEPDNDLEITIDYNNETCALNDAGATVYPTGGNNSYTVVWDNLPETPYLDNQILSSGAPETHTVVVEDDKGCMVTETITLFGYKNVFLPDYATSYTGTFCRGDQIEINIDEKPGLSYIWTMLNGDTIAKTANLNVTSDSSWGIGEVEILTLTIIDPACIIPQSVTATIYLTSINPGCTVLNEEAPITIIEGTEITLSSNPSFNTYQWTNTDGEELSTVNEFNFSPTNSDWYNLFVTDGPCIGYGSVYVAVGVISVDAISPNGDGYNDDWYIEDLGLYNSTVQFFNRWGDMLFEYKGIAGSGKDYITNDDFDWESLSLGTYYYIIDLDNGSDPQTGPLTIIK